MSVATRKMAWIIRERLLGRRLSFAMGEDKLAKPAAAAVIFRTYASSFVVLALLALGCRDKAADITAPGPARTEEGVDVTLSPKALLAAEIRLDKPKRVPKRTAVTAAGTLDFVPSRVARIGPQVQGRILSISVVAGQMVGRGAIVARLDSVDIGRARADFLEARSRLDLASAEVAREQRMLDAGASSERAMLTAKTDQRVAEVGMKANAERLRVLGAGSQAGGGLGAALVSPVVGKVLEVKARIGQPVGPTDTLFVVGATSELWLVVELYERDIGKVHLGDDVAAATVAFPGRTFKGKVDQLGAVVDATRHVLEARIVLDNPDDALRPGMTASARILGAVDSAAQVTVVPRQAIQTIDGQPFTFVERGPGKFEMRAVERGSEVDEGVEIVRGLAANETIVVDGAFILKSEVLREQMGAND